jgi:hypothetical protein
MPTALALPIGGIKGSLLAARRAGLQKNTFAGNTTDVSSSGGVSMNYNAFSGGVC